MDHELGPTDPKADPTGVRYGSHLFGKLTNPPDEGEVELFQLLLPTLDREYIMKIL